MPIMSYLAYPVEGRKAALEQALAALEGCDVTPAENGDVLVLVTDTPDKQTHEALEERLRQVPSLQCLALVAAYADPVDETSDTPRTPAP